MKKIVSTFNPEHIPYKKHALMYKKLFDCLKQHVVILPPLDMHHLKKGMNEYKKTIDQAGFIFHYTGMLMAQFPHSPSYYTWLENMMRSRGFCWASQHPCTDKKEQQCIAEINACIRSQNNVFINADIFFRTEEELYMLLEKQGLPVVKRVNREEFEKAKFFPAVLKYVNTTKAQGVYYLENERQLNVLSPKNCLIMRFIESPSEYYTHYRIYTVGTSILAAVLCYSGARKIENLRIINKQNIYDNPESCLFLNRKLIASNRTYGGKIIPLNPNKNSRRITEEEQNILYAHRIHEQKLPDALAQYAVKTAKLASEKGLYILGQDWIQDANGNFYCLEINWGPELTSIDVVYNESRENDDVSRTIAAEKIAKAIIDDL